MNSILKIILFAAFVSGFVFAPVEAKAQYTGANLSTWNNPISSTASVVIMNNMNRKMLEKSLSKRKASSGANRSAISVSRSSRLPFSATSFRPVIAVPIMPQKMAEQIPNTNQQQRQQMTKLYEELLDVYNRQIAAKEPKLKNNLAGALLFISAISYNIATDEELTDAQQKALFQAFVDAMGETEEFKKLEARGRQQMYEAFAITGSFLAVMHSQAQENKDKEMLRQVKEMASEMFEQVFGRSPDKIVFTDEGVELQ